MPFPPKEPKIAPGAPKRLPDGRFRHKYGAIYPQPLPDWWIELRMWYERFDTGLDPVEHLRRYFAIVHPDTAWHEWREQRFRSLTDTEFAHKSGGITIHNVSWVGAGAAGKAQPMDSVVYTPSGPRKMGEIKTGDLVCAPDGQIAPVVGVFPRGDRMVYELTLTDGSSTKCCADHIWLVNSEDWDAPRLVDTNFLIENHRRVSGGRIRNKFSISFTKPAYFYEQATQIDPYFMGALLGNGCFGGINRKGALGFSSQDADVLARIQGVLGGGYALKNNEGSFDYRISKKLKGGLNDYISALRGYGLWGLESHQKFVPSEFLLNSTDNRLAILQGLLDTDGTVEKGQASFCSTSQNLAEAVRFLVQSLGGSCRFYLKSPKFTYNGERNNGKPAWICSIQFQDPSQLFFCQRKKSKCKIRKFGGRGRVISSIKPVGTEKVQCILIDHPDHLYLTDNFIPTHNTNDAGDFAFAWWLADPAQSTVILTSTAKGKIKQRVWPLIQSRFVEAKQAFEESRMEGPHMLNSTMELQCIKGDSKHAIFAQAVEPGELNQAVEKIKGVHCPRIMLVIDEAPGTPDAIYSCIPNMQKGCTELVILSIGNGPMTHLDCFSRACTPVGGFGAITVESEAWVTRPVPEFQLPRGRCLHFDGTKSPNVKAGKTLFPFLYTWENWQLAQANPEFQRTAAFYSQDRGFWPPEGFLRTVLTEEMIERGNARGTVEFAGGTTVPVGSLDSGFGGDNCTLRFGRRGKLGNGKIGLQIDERIIIPIMVDAIDPATGKKIPAEYQIAHFIIREAEKRKVKPENFGVECTGTGRGAAAVLTQEWGEVIWCESGGRPSEMPASEEDPRPSREVYDRRITELWFSVQAFVKESQIGGLIDDDVIQFCARQYDFVSKKYVLEKKEDLKPRLGRSSDDADSVAVLVDCCRRHGMQTIGPRAERMMSTWDKEINLQQRLYQEDSLYQPEEMAAEG